MKTSNISRVSASIPQTKKSKFNLNHDVNTTYDWGSVQPLFGKMLLPDSSINVQDEQLTRLAPMVCPTFGRVKVKNIAHFVPMQEIWPNWDAMMSQTKVTRSSLNSSGSPVASTYVPKKVPFISNNFLVAMILAGAKVSLYYSGPMTGANAAPNDWFHNANRSGSFGVYNPPATQTGLDASRAYLSTLLGLTNAATASTASIARWHGYSGFFMNVSRLVQNSNTGKVRFGSQSTVFDMPSIATMFPNAFGSSNKGYTWSASDESITTGTGDYYNAPITFDSADLIWEFDGSTHQGILAADRAANSGYPVEGITNTYFDGRRIRLCFKLSSFGKRLRKVLIGLGYDVNLANDDPVSILPLIAYYKAWWDSYAPERYRNFYETSAWKLVNICLADATSSDIETTMLAASAGNLRQLFVYFMADLGTCFATEKMDVISAATDTYSGATNTTTTGTMTSLQSEILNQVNDILGLMPTDVPLIGPGGQVGTTMYPGGQAINQVAIEAASSGNGMQLTQPQIDALKKAYIMMNKSSVAGMKVEEILRALGQGDYVEECKGKFITATDDGIKISDVVATSDTYDSSTDSGSQLGQYGGRGLGYGTFQFSFSTNRHGYLVILSAIVPESGYTNSPAHENECVMFEDMYNPELDGLAYEALEKKQITGCPLINDTGYKNTFGFVPTYTQWKFMSNKANGDFSLNSMKTTLLPYTLDKYVPLTDVHVSAMDDQTSTSGILAYRTSPQFNYSMLPNAGEDYRYVAKFPWIGDYNRIFSAVGDEYNWSVFSPNNSSFEFLSFDYDNFLCHNVMQVSYLAHMKSIEDSYGTFDEEHGAPNTSIQRS